jgi:hypothetical protein
MPLGASNFVEATPDFFLGDRVGQAFSSKVRTSMVNYQLNLCLYADRISIFLPNFFQLLLEMVVVDYPFLVV